MTVIHNDRLEYMPQLDSLRAFAVLAVFYQHCFSHEYWLFHVPWGGVGVLCFFVISGFLITSILLKEFDGSASLRSVIVPFLIRRAARLMPLLAAVLAIAFVLDFPSMRATFWWHITYLSNIYFSFHGFHSGANHFWTLAAEEQFYIFWPLVLFLYLGDLSRLS
jgi:peptidoglycan/LPS O-acetylase OafA/YrhL